MEPQAERRGRPGIAELFFVTSRKAGAAPARSYPVTQQAGPTTFSPGAASAMSSLVASASLM